jgi:probable HAF family extracellular repeat protein
MRWGRIGALLFVALAACSLGAGYGSTATHGGWSVTDVTKLAALAYPEFKYVAFAGATSDDRIYWLSSGKKDGREVRELFEWQNGTISDLGSVPFLFGEVNDRGAIVGSDDFAPYGPGPRPPIHLYLWRAGTVTTLGTFAYADFAGLNDRGQVAEEIANARNELHAALWDNGRTIDLGSLGGKWSSATALNDRGQVVGGSLPAEGRLHAFLWQQGRMTDLGTLRGNYSQAVALNDRGQVVGYWGTWGARAQRAFIWQNGRAADLGRVSDPLSLSFRINNRGQVIRSRSGFLGANVGVLWEQGKTINLGGLGGGQTWPLAINDRGQVVGTSATRGSTLAEPKLRAFLWQDGAMTALPGPVAYPEPAMRIDPSGTHIVAGTCCNPGLLLLWTRRP